MSKSILSSRSWRLVGPVAILAVLLANLVVVARPALAASPNIVISQVYGGGGNSGATLKNDFIELYNRGATPVTIDGWSVQYASSAGTSWQRTNLLGTIAPGKYYLVQEAAGSGGTTALPSPDASGSIAMSGTTGKVALVNNTTALSGICPTAGVVDFVGYGGANCFEGTSPAPAPSNTTAVIRKLDGATDTDNNGSDFTAAAPSPRNSGRTSITTQPQSQTIAVGQTATLSVTASGTEPLSYQWYQGQSGDTSSPISGATGSSYTTPALGATTSYWVKVSNSLGSANSNTATITVNATNPCEQPATKISAVQGSGLSTPLAGSITVQGVVTAVFPGLEGFYVQEEVADRDDNPATSEGLFVFTDNMPSVTVGSQVRVTGNAAEFPANNTSSATQLTRPAITECGSGETILPVDIVFPLSQASDFEAYEGMLVRFPQELFIAEYFNYDRFGEIVLGLPLPGTDRFYTPTSITTPGAAANALADQYALRRITLDDGSTAGSPAVLPHPNGEPFSATNRFRGGDTVAGQIGVIDNSFNIYRVQPVQAGVYTATNPRPAAPADVGGTLKVASYNVLNYFLTVDTTSSNSSGPCGPLSTLDCRGADSVSEFQRQRSKLLQALLTIDADIYGLIEMENTAGVDPLADIVAGLNAATAPGTFARIDTGTIGGDAIKVGIIYKPGKVTPAGSYQTLDENDDLRFDTSRSRPALAQTFDVNATGARFTVVVNHLKSKGSACAGDPDTGDGQGNCNLTRLNAARALVDWLATDPTGSADLDFLIVGDLNSYAQEDPIVAIEAGADDAAGTGDDYVNLIEARLGLYAYSYVFNGQAGYLDYALASTTLDPQVTGVTDWHLNADEPDLIDYNDTVRDPGESTAERKGLDVTDVASPFRTSDHDPVIVGLDLIGYNFTGFFKPIDNLPVVNSVKAGRAVPIKFSLGGDKGLDMFAPGYPKVQAIACDTGTPVGGLESTVTAGDSSLAYDPASDSYTYVWKTDKTWTGCRQLVVRLNDGTEHYASFQFK